ncbi:MAG: type II toxin-antitoxin system VapC family toxin [Ignavibacteriaceae bacterium]
MRRYTIDTSVFVSALLSKEEKHNSAVEILSKIYSENSLIILPYTVLIEIASAIIRRTKSEELMLSAIRALTQNEKIIFVKLDKDFSIKTIKTILKFNLRGMDSILVQVSLRYKTELISFDEEINSKLKGN